MSDIRTLLRGLALERLADAFEREDIDPEAAGLLREEDFDRLGVPLGPRRRIQAALASKPTQVSTEPPIAPVDAAAAERRQLTVLFCDLVGSTALSQRLDPEELRALIRAYQDACVGAITRFGGHVAQYLGDGVLAYFGYPVAREGGAESAIRAGLAIQERIHELASGGGSVPAGVELRARVGIDTGLVVIGQSLEGSEQDRTAVGDAPNIAARIQSMAEPGMVVTSGRTHALAEAGFEWQSMGSQNVAGVADRVPLWRVAGERRTESRFDAAAGPLLAPMVGRDLEFATVRAAWDQVLSGRSQAVLLCGEPGIGKSRVLRALRELVRDQGVVPWQYQCSPYYANSDYYPLVAHFERVLKFERDESPEVRLDRVEAMVCGSFGLPRRDANLLARLFGLPAEARYGALGLSPQKQKDETLRVLGDLIRSAGRQKPVLFLFEDAHWADPTTLDAIAAVVARLSEMRVLVVLTHRPEFKAAWSGQPNVTALTLGKLDAGQVAQVVTRVAGGQPLPEALVRQIVAKTDGVPLFVEELTKAIL